MCLTRDPPIRVWCTQTVACEGVNWLTTNWDNYLAINPYQDTPLGSFVAFAAVIVYIGNLNKISIADINSHMIL